MDSYLDIPFAYASSRLANRTKRAAQTVRASNIPREIRSLCHNSNINVAGKNEASGFLDVLNSDEHGDTLIREDTRTRINVTITEIMFSVLKKTDAQVPLSLSLSLK